eukprot:1251462-Pleurochrysis_carterae.AAC.3
MADAEHRVGGEERGSAATDDRTLTHATPKGLVPNSPARACAQLASHKLDKLTPTHTLTKSIVRPRYLDTETSARHLPPPYLLQTPSALLMASACVLLTSTRHPFPSSTPPRPISSLLLHVTLCSSA